MSKFKTYGIFSSSVKGVTHPLYHDGENGWRLKTEDDFVDLFIDHWPISREKIGTLKIPMEYLT